MPAAARLLLGIVLSLPLMADAQTPSFKQGRKPLGMERDEKNLWGLWLMGQSLCDGSESLPIVTPADTKWGNCSFARGVRTWIAGNHGADPEHRAASEFELVPLKAMANGALGETMANGLADHLKSTLVEPTVAAKEQAAPHFLVAYAGQGGRMIDELSSVDQSTDARSPAVKKGEGGYYKTSLDDARRAVAQATAHGGTFAVAALVWMQGEANGGPTGGINPSRWDTELPRPEGQEWYRDRLIAYRKQWSHDLCAITGQKEEIPLFTYQTLGPAGEAQVMAADLDPHIYLVGCHYMVPSAINSRRNGGYGAAIHLTADGERWWGEQVAKVARRVLEKGEAWQPLRPRRAVLDAARSSVLVTFLVPRPPLVLEDAFLPQEHSEMPGGHSSLEGFQLRDAKGAVLALKEVTTAAPDKLRLVLASPLPAGARCTLSYGLPNTGQIGVISAVRKGPSAGPQPTTELVIPGGLPAALEQLMDEGAFTIGNGIAGEAYAQAVIRHARAEAGSTVLRFEDRELRNGVPFAVGQTVTAGRPFQYGNLRDSDAETALYSFADDAYGRRAGKKYPLWNWCILFSQFPVAEK